MADIQSLHFIGLPELLETPADLTRRARSLMPAARTCAIVGGHKLGRFVRVPTGRRDYRYYSATCSKCQQPAYVNVGPGLNEYGGGAVAYRCAAIPENRCEIVNGQQSQPVPCGAPFLTIWRRYAGQSAPGSYGPAIRVCLEHSRVYRSQLEHSPVFGYRQTGGPVDY